MIDRRAFYDQRAAARPRESNRFYQRLLRQHYAFLVSEQEFDQIFGRIQARKVKYWADPGQKQEGEINHHFGGRGVYFEDPSGHLLEIITRPYGDWPA